MRLVSLATAVLLALGGIAGYARLNTPQPVSAQTLLHRAAAALQLARDQAAHATYAVTVTVSALEDPSGKAAGGLTGTADVWVQAGAGGVPAMSAESLTMNKGGTFSRFVQIGPHVYAYNPEMRGDNMITIDMGRGRPSWLVPADVFDGATTTQQLSALATQSPERVQLLPGQTFDGVAVDPVEVDGWNDRPGQRTVFYFDSTSYLLRGFDAASQYPSYPTPSWQVRLTGYTTMPAAAVPAGTFTLNAPASAQVRLPDLGDPAASKILGAALTGACRGINTVNLKGLLRSGQTMLAACQAAAPGVTQAGLVDALAAPYQALIQDAATAGQVTPAQAADGVAALRAWLTAMISSTGGQTG
jgi:hypothetical protein